jgi:tetratricopeptide (TPR) repeat protein
MALFGFNKQKVLNSAEKYVQQGKLQNAIAEYEKVLKNDAKDLTVANTVGDLYSRLGETDKATECFKTVGDAYAGQGFTVKAIAMYKKISKLKPSLENVLKLAELYTQQGLFNDARAQYLQVAEEFLKSGELENAVRIFQKILEMDPENTAMRVKLAEVYVRLGKKTEAWQIFSAAAESMRSRGSLSGAEEVLQRMLTLDPGNAYALLMQGKNMVESGDAGGAIAALQKISDIDSNPDGLRDLLKAYLLAGQLSDAGTVANKLLTVHNDLASISSFADALMQAGQFENALQVYDQHADRLLAENSEKVLDNLHIVIGHVRENPGSLEKLLDLFQKAGETTHVSEVTELLAHASVQAGDLTRARDLYQKLATVEPQNPLHMQNYQQVVGQIGGTSGDKVITAEEAAVLVDELEATAPSVHQHYSDEVALSVRSALTDAELFISYNMPAKALGPLVVALPLAPRDLRLNQRLAALHTRAGRFAEAALCCRTLQSVYSEAEFPEEATRYGELADRYEDRSPVQVLPDADAHIFLDAPATVAPPVEVESVEIDEPAAEVAEEEMVVAPPAQSWPSADAAEEFTVEAGNEVAEFAVVQETPAAPAVEEVSPAEIDLSSEWDDTITVEDDAAPAAVVEAAVVEAAAVEDVSAHAGDEVPDAENTDETVEEIRFYLGHGMPEQAMAALAKLQTLTRDQAKLAMMRAEVEAAAQSSHEEAAVAEPVMEEIAVEDIPSVDVASEVTTEVAIEEEVEVEAAPVEVARVEPEVEPDVEEVEVEQVEEIPVMVSEISQPEPEPAPAAHGVLEDFVSDLESSLGDNFLPGAIAKPASPPAITKPSPAATVAKPAAARTEETIAAQSKPVLGEFVADIEASLGEDFLKAAPVPAPTAAPTPASVARVAKAKPAATAAPTVDTVAAPAPKIAPPLAASAAAASATPSHAAQVVAPGPAPIAQPPAPAVSWPAPPKVEAPRPQPAVAHSAPAPVAPTPAPAAKSPFGEEAGIDLAEMFGELRQDLESDTAAADEDPETHYNLGIAFREMGLLDEAIGELQKACAAFDHGHPFPQIMQTYTWLAQCFLDKGVPEAAVRWYDKALQVAGIDGETRVALHYELASAYEAAGDKPSALKHFMDVYGTNIDYRDVSERIKALKS